MFLIHKPVSKMFVLDPPKPLVIVSEIAASKMWEYVDQSPEEVSWYGSVEVVPDKEFHYLVKDVYLFRQEVSTSTTKATGDGVIELYERLANEGVDTDTIRLWGHSHHTMGVEPSEQDNKQMHDMFKGHCPWAIRLICNKHGKMGFSVYLYDNNVAIQDVDWLFESEDRPYKESIAAELAELVSKKVYPQVSQIGKKSKGGTIVPFRDGGDAKRELQQHEKLFLKDTEYHLGTPFYNTALDMIQIWDTTTKSLQTLYGPDQWDLFEEDAFNWAVDPENPYNKGKQ